MESVTNKDICELVLKVLDNQNVKVKLKKDINGNYYSFLNNTIYLTNRELNKEELKKPDLKCGQLITICHECIHSTQSRWLHILNVLFSNLAIVLALLFFIRIIMYSGITLLGVLESFVLLVAILLRLILEIDAIKKSTFLAENLVRSNSIQSVTLEQISQAKIYINKLMPIQLIRIVALKILVLTTIIVCCIKLQ